MAFGITDTGWDQTRAQVFSRADCVSTRYLPTPTSLTPTSLGEQKGNSATRPEHKCRMVPRPAPNSVVVTLDGVSLFVIVPTIMDLFRGVVLPLRAIW
jgi:hypothetical protein